jgi:hypothetical protein
MSQLHQYDPETRRQILSQTREVGAAIQQSVREAVLRHKRDGHPVVVWKDGKVEWIPAHLIPSFEK